MAKDLCENSHKIVQSAFAVVLIQVLCYNILLKLESLLHAYVFDVLASPRLHQLIQYIRWKFQKLGQMNE
jgi:hypothetical protein